MIYYTYIHSKPDGLPFYVGKGKRGRAREFKHGRSNHHKNTVNKFGKNNILIDVIPCKSEKAALSLEVVLIKAFRLAGHALVNVTSGGEFPVGVPLSEDHKRKLSESLKNRHFTDEHKAKIGAAQKGRVFSDETRCRMSAAKKGKPQVGVGFLGRTHGEQARKAISNILSGVPKEKVMCVKCGQMIGVNAMPQHTRGKRCFKAYLDSRAE